LKARRERLLYSRLSLTDFGREVSDRDLDFSLHNQIHRWWGGTELTNDRRREPHPCRSIGLRLGSKPEARNVSFSKLDR